LYGFVGFAACARICANSCRAGDRSATRPHQGATAPRFNTGIETAGDAAMNKFLHSETASTVFQVITIAAMAVFSIVSLFRGAGLMG